MMYDIVIVGSGLGGLQCGYILSKEGYKVCVLEKNARIGGCLQTFYRKGVSFDTGIHYIGGLDDGQLLNQYFKYFGLMDKLSLQRLDESGFDRVTYSDKEYSFAMGYERFTYTLVKDFPNERGAIEEFLKVLKQQSDLVGIDQLRNGRLAEGGIEKFGTAAYPFIQQLSQNETFKSVLSGNILLLNGSKQLTPLFAYALVIEPYITSAYKFTDGSQQLADVLTAAIQKNGGEVLANHEVSKIRMNDKGVTGVSLTNGKEISTRYLISNVHPQKTLSMLEDNRFLRKAYYTRINSLQNGSGIFSVYIVLKPQSVRYRNFNHYFYQAKDLWELSAYQSNQPRTNVLTTFIAGSNSRAGEGYAEGISILTPMFWEEVKQWENTTVGQRGADYEAMKQRKAEELIAYVCQYIPELKNGIEAYYTSSPLSYRDYTGTPEGSSYGIMKSCLQPEVTLISSKTRIPNMLFTGQNMNLHGVLGVSLTSAMTCAEFLGEEYLAKKIANC